MIWLLIYGILNEIKHKNIILEERGLKSWRSERKEQILSKRSQAWLANLSPTLNFMLRTKLQYQNVTNVGNLIVKDILLYYIFVHILPMSLNYCMKTFWCYGPSKIIYWLIGLITHCNTWSNAKHCTGWISFKLMMFGNMVRSMKMITKSHYKKNSVGNGKKL